MAAGDYVIRPDGTIAVDASGNYRTKNASNGCAECCEESCPACTGCDPSLQCPTTGSCTPQTIIVNIAGGVSCPPTGCVPCPLGSREKSHIIVSNPDITGSHAMTRQPNRPGGVCYWRSASLGTLAWKSYESSNCSGTPFDNKSLPVYARLFATASGLSTRWHFDVVTDPNDGTMFSPVDAIVTPRQCSAPPSFANGSDTPCGAFNGVSCLNFYVGGTATFVACP